MATMAESGCVAGAACSVGGRCGWGGVGFNMPEGVVATVAESGCAAGAGCSGDVLCMGGEGQHCMAFLRLVLSSCLRPARTVSRLCWASLSLAREAHANSSGPATPQQERVAQPFSSPAVLGPTTYERGLSPMQTHQELVTQAILLWRSSGRRRRRRLKGRGLASTPLRQKKSRAHCRFSHCTEYDGFFQAYTACSACSTLPS